MTAPTVPVTVDLADFGGPAIAGVKITARMSKVDMTAAGVVVSNAPVVGITDATGRAVLNCFPNALVPTGLGTKGASTKFTATIPHSSPLNVLAVIPNAPCKLVDVQVDLAPPPPPPDFLTRAGYQPVTNKTMGNNADKSCQLVDDDLIQWNCDDGRIAKLTMSTQRGVRVLATPQNAKDGTYTLIVKNHPNGGQGFTGYGTGITLVDNMAPNPAANSITVYEFKVVGTDLIAIKHGATTVAPSPSPTPAPAPTPAPGPAIGPAVAAFKSGVNLSGMEGSAPNVRFGTSTSPDLNYSVPRAATIAHLAANGVTLVRLNVIWEMLQPILAGAPANATVLAGYTNPLQSTFAAGDLWEPYAAAITAVLDACYTYGVRCVIDIHNYCRYMDFVYQPDGSIIGFNVPTDRLYPPYAANTEVVRKIFSKASNVTLTVAHYVNLWQKIATKWKDHPGLGGYGLMNEPNNMPAVGKNFGIDAYPNPFDPSNDYAQDFSIWPTYAQAAATAIRAIDSTMHIYCGGNDYQNPMAWATINPGLPLTGVSNVIYECHLYLDASSAGSRFDYTEEQGLHFSAGEGGVDISAATGTNRLAPFFTWLAAHGNPPAAVGEFGIPIEAREDGNAIDPRWLTAADATLLTMKNNNMRVFVWMGGDHWPTRPYPIGFVGKLHQNRTVEPLANAYFKKHLAINSTTVFDEGGQYSTAGAAITRTVQARGNGTSAINLTVASDNGGTFSKTALTLAAGVNSTDSFTFTPVANSVTTLTYTRTGGGQVPPPVVIYSLTDPVAYAATDLAKAAKTILAKYSAACWLAKDALKEFLTPVAAAAGDMIRGISNSGSGGTVESPMEAINWYNRDAGAPRSAQLPVLYNLDTNALPAMDFREYGRRGLFTRKLAPLVSGRDVYRRPTSRMPFDLTDPHFLVSAFKITSDGTNGVLMSASKMDERQHTALGLIGGKLQLDQQDSTIPPDSNVLVDPAASAIPVNTLTTASLVSTQGGQRLRKNGVQVAASTKTFSAGPHYFDTICTGFGYWGYYPQDAGQLLKYGGIAGRGNPTDAELGVLENYLASFGTPVVGGPPPTGGAAILQAAFDAGKVGTWLKRVLADMSTDPASYVAPTSYSGIIARWKNHGAADGHDLLETVAIQYPTLQTVAAHDSVHIYHGTKMLGVGGASTAFYFAFWGEDTSYSSTIASDRSTAHHGFRVRYDGDSAGSYFLDIGTGSATVTLPLLSGFGYRPPGNDTAHERHLIEAWFDGTTMGLRVDGSSTVVATQALGATPMAASLAADVVLCGDYPLGTGENSTFAAAQIYFKNYCPSSSDRNAIATYFMTE
jgi:endoglucanase